MNLGNSGVALFAKKQWVDLYKLDLGKLLLRIEDTFINDLAISELIK